MIRMNRQLEVGSMGRTGAERWVQRLASFGTALARLDEACAKESYTDLERAGLAQTFMFTYELGWKTLRDLLSHLGFTVNSPRETIRQAFESGYLDAEDCEAFLRALDNRNRLSHVYSGEEARHAEALIKGEYHEILRRLYLRLEQGRNQ